jgi:Flp pilus assembly protein TadD
MKSVLEFTKMRLQECDNMYVIVLRAAAALLTLGAALAPVLASDTDTCKAADGDDSVAACSRIIAKHPRYATAYYSRARVYGRNGDYDSAIADLDRAIRLQPKNADFYTERCWAWDSKHEEDRAIADCLQATILDSRKAVTFGQRADAGMRVHGGRRPQAFT